MTYFHKILIANRGEIALRIIRTCREMGLATVAVHSEADSQSLFVEQADEAVHIGGNAPVESYLNQDKIIQAAKRTGAQAIHPGYGFLAENASFAARCKAEGIIFIGPDAQAIDVMGSKINAKAIMQEHDVPTIPGYRGEDQSTAKFVEEAKQIGFPILVKASAGGGGKGMRIVRKIEELEAAINGAKREAKAAFGDDALLIEKYFDSAKHIEVQIIGDQHGTVLHCFERECSIQRRFQKIIEEAPSPTLTPKLRADICEAAVRAAKSINYTNAGTVEFIYDTKSEQFFFLEVNTRLQVEHPVTEAITGIDLVRWQIMVAQGLPLPLEQKELKINGHALECRLYAEDAKDDFRPATGTILNWNTGTTPNVRYDSGVRTGDKIDIFYDPMIAKIITHGNSRIEATHRMAKALGELSCLGLTTNRHFLIQILRNVDFIHNKFDTRFVDKNLARLSEQSLIDDISLQKYAMAATLFQWKGRAAQHRILQALPTGWRSNFHKLQYDDYQVNDKIIRVEYRHHGDRQFEIKTGDSTAKVFLNKIEGQTVELTIDGHRQSFKLAYNGPNFYVQSAGKDAAKLLLAPRFPEIEEEKIPGGYQSPMPGEVVKVLVTLGDAVKEGDPLLVLSSMKMENTIYAEEAGKVEEIYVTEKGFVEANTLMLKIATK